MMQKPAGEDAGRHQVLKFFDRYEVFDFLNHTKDLRGSDDLTLVADSAKAQSQHSSFLTGRTTNDTAYLGDFKFLFRHDKPP